MLLLSVLTYHNTTGGRAFICCVSVPDSNASPFVHFIGIFKMGKACKNPIEQNQEAFKLFCISEEQEYGRNIPPKQSRTQATVKGPSSPAEELA